MTVFGRVFGAGLLATAIFGAASAQTTPASEQAASVASAARTVLKAQQDLMKALPAPGTVAVEMSRRASLDQFGRQVIGVVSASNLSQADRSRALGLIWKDLEAIDAANSDYVKSVLPADGWFRNSRDGVRLANDAWLIVQHSQDHPFRKQVAAAMEPLVKEGEADAQNFALLYDRNQMNDGRPQRYGSQASCKDGAWAIHTLEDPARVDEMRRSMGMTETLAEYSQQIGIGKPC